tara:strand:- start:4217 stop:5389 length:1173 start_codon:yes stop_codon:yes gene_type:complete
MNLTPQQRVTKAHISIMRHPELCMFSGVLSIGEVKFVDTLPTAATNGRDVFYNPEFINTLDQKELTFVVLHEAIHKVYQHLRLWSKLWKIDARLTNMSADYVVNHTIKEADPNETISKMPACGLYEPTYAGMTTRQIFDILKQDQEENGGGAGGGKEGFDDHDWQGASELTEEEQEKLSGDIDKALRQGQVLRGTMGGKSSRGVDELLEPKINWREELLEFITATCRAKDASSWKRPSRRFIGDGIYLPSLIGQSVGKLVVAVDTSGSIGNHELTVFLSEIVSICEDVHPESIELLYWDADVAGHETYHQGDYDGLATTTKPAGGGGTRVGCVNQYIKDKQINAEAVIVLTDGYVESDWGGPWELPTLWVVTTRGLDSPHGKSIYLDMDQ